jgi:hypothetical protein
MLLLACLHSIIFPPSLSSLFLRTPASHYSPSFPSLSPFFDVKLSHAVVDIAMHPEFQAKLQAELDTVQPDRNKPFTPDMVTEENLPYFHALLNESMRLHPAAAQGSLREAPVDFEYDGMFIPKGSTLQVPMYAVHRSATIRQVK